MFYLKCFFILFIACIFSGCSSYEVTKSRQYTSSGVVYSTTTSRYAYPATYYYRNSYYPHHYYFKHSIYPYYHPYRYRMYRYYRW